MVENAFIREVQNNEINVFEKFVFRKSKQFICVYFKIFIRISGLPADRRSND